MIPWLRDCAGHAGVAWSTVEPRVVNLWRLDYLIRWRDGVSLLSGSGYHVAPSLLPPKPSAWPPAGHMMASRVWGAQLHRSSLPPE